MNTTVATGASVFFPDFFSGNEFIIDEKISFFKFGNEYIVYDGAGGRAGSIIQKMPAGRKLLRIFLKKAVLPFTFCIVDNNHKTLLSIHRGWTFWMSKIEICDEKGSPLGYIKQKFKLVKPRFKIYGPDKKLVAEINGDWKAWTFSIIDMNHTKVGVVNKQWNGLSREVFTTSDKYHVAIEPGSLSTLNKQLIVATAITIDMVLKQSN
jgi:uncharacterized protein YxjI